jgi:TolB-like protein
MIHTDPVQPEAEAIKAQLERTLASRGFVTAGRQSRLLRHIVERTLAGQADQLKEYSVGMEVFDRDDKYDPRIDSIVRVEAGRLRSRLDEYYATDGAGDAVRISLPRGAYVATFEPNVQGAKPAVTLSEGAPVVAEQPAARRSWALWALGTTLVAVVAGMVMWLGEPQATPGAPSVAVLAFEQYSASEDDGAIAAQLTDNVTAELARLGTVGVVSHTSAMQFAGERRPLREIAQVLNAAFIVEGSVENVAGGIRVMARIVNATTDRKMWVQDFAGRPDDLRTLSKSIAAGVSEAVLKGPPAP